MRGCAAVRDRAWEHLRKGNLADNPKAWLYAIARNIAIDELRRAKRTTHDESGEEGPSAIENQLDLSRFANPEDAVETLNLKDGAGVSVSDSATATVRWIC